jgi:hypothetical protein
VLKDPQCGACVWTCEGTSIGPLRVFSVTDGLRSICKYIHLSYTLSPYGHLVLRWGWASRHFTTGIAPGGGRGVPRFGGVALALSHISEVVVSTTPPSAEGRGRLFGALQPEGPRGKGLAASGNQVVSPWDLGKRRTEGSSPSSSKGVHLRVEGVALHM